MTIREIIDFVDEIKPNAFSNAQKTVWLNEVEGMVQADVMLLAQSSMIDYLYEAAWVGTGLSFPDDTTMTFPAAPGFVAGGLVTVDDLVTYANNNVASVQIEAVSSDGKKLFFPAGTFTDTGKIAETARATVAFNGAATEMLVSAPHHKIYYTYLMAMIDFANGEYGKYQNTMILFNTFFSNYTKWFIDHYHPADGKAQESGYYISAYAIAVKHGFGGTEEEWLATLKGDRGEIGKGIRSVEKTGGSGASGTTDTYTITMTDDTTSTFTVYNGSNGIDGITPTIDDGLSSLSANPVQNNVIKTALDAKADLVNGTIPGAQLPSYVDDVIEVNSYASLPITGEGGKIYITVDDNKQWRWSGSAYAQISESLALGETAATAYRGDRGATAYAHSQTTGNPHGLTKSGLLGDPSYTNSFLGGNPGSSPEWVAPASVRSAIGAQPVIDNSANRIFYGSGDSGTLNQLTMPSKPALLQQNPSGAPFWGMPLYKYFVEVLLDSQQTIATTARTKLNFNTLGYISDDYGLFTVDSTGLKINQTGYYSLYYYVDLGAAAGTGTGGLLWIGTNNNQQRFHRRLDGGNNADYADDILLYMSAGEYVYISIQQGSATSNAYGNSRDRIRIVLRPISL